ncbi:Speckle-type POZ protein [Hordeum vulgare]|nr:Speckle-type POZ protein [Hordeum vulgare]
MRLIAPAPATSSATTSCIVASSAISSIHGRASSVMEDDIVFFLHQSNGRFGNSSGPPSLLSSFTFCVSEYLDDDARVLDMCTCIRNEMRDQENVSLRAEFASATPSATAGASAPGPSPDATATAVGPRDECPQVPRQRQGPFDVRFDVDDEILKAHRMVVAAQSAWFEGLLYGHGREAGKDILEVGGGTVTAEAFCGVLHLIYTDELPVEATKGRGSYNLMDKIKINILENFMLDSCGCSHGGQMKMNT